MKKKKPDQTLAKKGGKEVQKDEPAEGENRPRNLLVTSGATTPVTFSFVGRYKIHTALTINQTQDEETWPGGALWDCGILLSQAIVALHGKITTTTTPVLPAGMKSKSTVRTVELPFRVHEALRDDLAPQTILELGCGVGLTGMVAATAFRSKLTIPTDLKVVVDKVTQGNLVKNSTAAAKPFRMLGGGKVVAVPLCWGCSEDEKTVRELLVKQDSDSTTKGRRKKKGGKDALTDPPPRLGYPDLILIGDVAYQHKPGAPSHFDVLLSTLLQFTDAKTLVAFGTRIRMPASVDLLDMFLQHFDPVVSPSLGAEEVDPTFAGVKHNMSIHFLRRKDTEANVATDNK